MTEPNPRVRVQGRSVLVRLNGLTNEEALDLFLTSAFRQAARILDELAALRRLRGPFTLRILQDEDDDGTPLMVAEDARGRRAAVRIEID